MTTAQQTGTSRAMRTDRCRCEDGDLPVVELSGEEVSLFCHCGQRVGPEPVGALKRLVNAWNHLMRRGE